MLLDSVARFDGGLYDICASVGSVFGCCCLILSLITRSSRSTTLEGANVRLVDNKQLAETVLGSTGGAASHGQISIQRYLVSDLPGSCSEASVGWRGRMATSILTGGIVLNVGRAPFGSP